MPGARATLFEDVLRWTNYGLVFVDVARNMDMLGDDDALYGWAPVNELSSSNSVLAGMYDEVANEPW